MDKTSKRKSHTRASAKRVSKHVANEMPVENVPVDNTPVDVTSIKPDLLKYNSTILFDNSDSVVSIKLKKGQTFYCNAGAMAWMDGKIEVKTRNRSGFFAGLKRMMLTDGTFFTTDYTGVSPEGNEIAFAPKLPGTVILIEIKPGNGIYVSGESFTAASNNVETAVKTRFRNMFFNEDTFMTKLKVNEKSTGNGSVWISSYGNIYKKVVEVGETFKVDTGYFVACDAGVNYSIAKVGGIKSFVLGGEGIVMYFKPTDKPFTLYLQTRNFSHVVQNVAKYIKPAMSGMFT